MLLIDLLIHKAFSMAHLNRYMLEIVKVIIVNCEDAGYSRPMQILVLTNETNYWTNCDSHLI